MNKQSDTKIQRPPIVVVMGHIDHGKSKLLDYIRKSNVVEGEAGGITQHIGAYEADVKCESSSHHHKTKKITFLDTPGHEAFSKMRIRGAKIADIAILVIAADEGIKPQTLEAYEAIKKANIPYIIAFNKMDNPGANPENIKGQLAENQIFVEGYGGDIPSVNISAKTGDGVQELLDLVLLMSEMENMEADKNKNASGIVIESHLDQKRGVSSTLLIQDGIMKKGMFIALVNAIAPVRIFEDFQGNNLEEASFSSPVKIIGFNNLPEVGMEFKAFNSKSEAEEFMKHIKENSSHSSKEGSLQQADVEEENNEDKIIVYLIIKADTLGSVEALEKEIKKLASENVTINLIRNDAGNIKEDDIKLVSRSKNPIIVGFNVNIDLPAKELAERFNVLIYTSDIIYKISEWLEEEIETRKKSIKKEEIIGRAKILKIFSKIKNKQLVGGEIFEGKIIEGKYVKIKRENVDTGKGKIKELQHNKEKIKEINSGKQFGAIIESETEILKNDEVEIIEKIK